MDVPEKLRLMQILRSGFGVYTRRFKDILLAAVIIYTPIALLDLFPLKVDFESFGFTEDFMSRLPQEFSSQININILADFALAFLIGTFLAPLGTIAIALISYNACEGKVLSFKDAIELSFKRWGKFIATSLVSAIIYFVTFIGAFYLGSGLGPYGVTFLPMIPTLILTICFAFSDYCVIIESKWGVSALVRSTKIIASNKSWVQVVLYSVVLFTIEFAILLLAGGMLFLGTLTAYCLASVVVCIRSCWFFNAKQIADSLSNYHHGEKNDF